MRNLTMWTVVMSIFIFFTGTSFAEMSHMKGSEGEITHQESIIKSLGNKMVCPVMATLFKADKDTKFYEHDGKTYYFCCPMCIDKFKANPKKYIAEKEKAKPHSGHH